MIAGRIHRFGPPDVICLEDVSRPEPVENEVLVRVRAAGVGPWDAWIRSGKSVLEQPLPLTLGSDFSGLVAALGKDVREFELGEEVFGVTNKRFTGAYAVYAVASAAMIAKKPMKLNHPQAASAPVVAVTALQMLFNHARVAAPQRVLIHGAGGNVGAYAVQLALAAGLHVIGTDVKQGIEHARCLGAHEVIDSDLAPFETVTGKVDVVIDTVGGDVQKRSLSILNPGGTLVSSVSQPDMEQASKHGVRAIFMLVDVTSAALVRIATLIDDGKLTTRVGSVLPLSEARHAHEMLEGLRSRQPGKIVLTVDDEVD